MFVCLCVHVFICGDMDRKNWKVKYLLGESYALRAVIRGRSLGWRLE